MSFILFVLSWLVPYAIYRADEQRAERIRNAHLNLGRIEKNPGARKRVWQAKKRSAIQAAVVMALVELPFLYFIDGLVYALGVSVCALLIGLVCMPQFEKTIYAGLDRRATDRALYNGETPDTGDFLGENDKYIQPVPKLAIKGQHGSASVESPERSGLMDRDGMAPVLKGGR